MDREHPGEVAEAHCCWDGEGGGVHVTTSQVMSLGLLHGCEEVDRCQVTAQI